MQRKTGAIMITHGSRSAEGNAIMGRVAQRLRVRLGTDLIEPCFMEQNEPTISMAIERLLAHGCNHIFAYAVFLVPGKHLHEDIPAMIAAALADHHGVTHEITGPILDDPDLFECIAQRLERALHHSRRPQSKTA
jgi:sirohydrochlorin cobaltochelatase